MLLYIHIYINELICLSTRKDKTYESGYTSKPTMSCFPICVGSEVYSTWNITWLFIKVESAFTPMLIEELSWQNDYNQIYLFKTQRKSNSITVFRCFVCVWDSCTRHAIQFPNLQVSHIVNIAEEGITIQQGSHLQRALLPWWRLLYSTVVYIIIYTLGFRESWAKSSYLVVALKIKENFAYFIAALHKSVTSEILIKYK